MFFIFLPWFVFLVFYAFKPKKSSALDFRSPAGCPPGKERVFDGFQGRHGLFCCYCLKLFAVFWRSRIVVWLVSEVFCRGLRNELSQSISSNLDV